MKQVANTAPAAICWGAPLASASARQKSNPPITNTPRQINHAIHWIAAENLILPFVAGLGATGSGGLAGIFGDPVVLD
jgi:hypothetical protein